MSNLKTKKAINQIISSTISASINAVLVTSIIVATLVAGVFMETSSHSIPVTPGQKTVWEELALNQAGEKVYESDVIKFDLDNISAFGAAWDQQLTEGTELKLEYRASASADWRELRVDHDVSANRDDDFANLEMDHLDVGQMYSEMIVGSGSQIQLRATLKSNGPAAKISDLTAFAYQTDPGLADNNSALAYGQVRIISRSEWGADESLRLYNDNNPEAQVKKSPGGSTRTYTEAELRELREETAIASTIETDALGRTYTWPEQESAAIKKIVIHHTSGAEPKTPDEAVAYLRSVYFFHAITRGWGDIGYNYVIDPFGNVYKGRAGGERAVGAHASQFNTGSIGISVMGNYQGHDITPDAKRSLVALVNQISKREGLDPKGYGRFRLVDMPTVVGHRDVGNTSCPGNTFYSSMADIRSLAAQDIVADSDPRWQPSLQSNKTKEVDLPDLPDRFDRDYLINLEKRLDDLDIAAGGSLLRPVSLTSHPDNPKTVTIAPGETKSIRLSFFNDGLEELTEMTYLRSDYIPSKLKFNGEEDAMIAARLKPGSRVKTGEIATFDLQMTLDGSSRGSFSLQFVPVVNGNQDISTGAARLTLVVDESGLGVVRQFKDAAIDSGKDVITAVTGLEVEPGDVIASDIDSSSSIAELPSESADEVLDNQTDAETAFRLPDDVAQMITNSTSQSDVNKPIRVLLSRAPRDNLSLKSDQAIRVVMDGNILGAIQPQEQFFVKHSGSNTVLTGTVSGEGQVLRFEPVQPGVIEIASWQRSATESISVHDNRFRGVLELRADSNGLMVINELDVEDYLRGLAEPNPADPPEKIKALVIVARTYALYYRDVDRKFPDAAYDLDDNPAVSQKYLGYGFEERAPSVANAVSETEGEVVIFEGKLVKTPYFSSSLGKTKSAYEVWGWTHTPYLQSVNDPCDDRGARGHGVGLSGCGARVLASQGKTAEEILKYFYTDIQISKI